jgi:predicted permease
MSQSWIVIVGALASVFAVIGVGILARERDWLSEEADQSLLRLIINVLMPCLILDTILGNSALKEPRNLLIPPVVGLATELLGFGLAIVVAHLGKRLVGLETSAQRGTFAACVGIYNYGYIPIPLVSLLFLDVAVREATMGVLFVHNMGVELGIWTAGVMLLSGRPGRNWWRQVLNPPCLSILVALTLNFILFSTAGSTAPRVLTSSFQMLGQAVHWLGQSAIPLSMVLIGATIADQLRPNGERANAADASKVIFWSCLLRVGLLPMVFLAIGLLVPGTAELKRVIAIQAAMPSAVFPIVMARHYGGDPPTALRVVLGTSLVSLVTIPFWIPTGLKLLGLGGPG